MIRSRPLLVFGSLTSLMILNGAASAEQVIASEPKIYSLDIFSLISFALTVTALLFSIFMGWLSWQFYVQSVHASEKTNETVAKIEILVSSIQININEIISKAIAHWVNGQPDAGVDQNSKEILEKLAELKSAVAVKSGDSDGLDNSNLLDSIEVIRSQVEDLNRSTREMQIRTLFPVNDASDSVSRAVSITQNIHYKTANECEGSVIVKVLRPTRIATATVRFSPPFGKIPKIDAVLTSSPYEDASSISAKPGTPSLRGCNLHLNSDNYLLLGEYVFEIKVSAL